MSDQYTPFPGQAGGFPHAGGAFPQQGAAPAGGLPAPGPGGAFGGNPPAARSTPPTPSAGGSKPAPATKTSRKKVVKDEKPPTKRLINRQIGIAAIFALLAGLVVAYLVTAESDTVFVVRTQSDITAGTSLSGSLLEAAELPAEAVEPNTYTAASAQEALDAALDDLDGTVTQFPLPAKAQIRSDQFGLQANLGQELDPTERLVSIQASVGTSVAGALSPGDRVDIIGATDGWTRVVAYDVPIVSITVSEDRYNSVADRQSTDKDVNPDELLPGNPVPGIYVLRLPAELVPSVVNWNESATLYLIYRGADAVTVPGQDSQLGGPGTAPALDPLRLSDTNNGVPYPSGNGEEPTGQDAPDVETGDVDDTDVDQAQD